MTIFEMTWGPVCRYVVEPVGRDLVGILFRMRVESVLEVLGVVRFIGADVYINIRLDLITFPIMGQ